MPERFDPVNSDDRNVILVTTQQGRVAFNVDLLKGIFVRTVCCFKGLFSFIAKMTTRTGINDDMSLP
jgi:hypothetical protein